MIVALQEGEEPVSAILEEARQCGATVLYEVDATALSKSLKVSSVSEAFVDDASQCSYS